MVDLTATHNRWTWAPTVLLTLTVFSPTPAWANDSSFGGSGADLRPLQETRIRMVSERIEIRLVDDASVSEPGYGANTHRSWRVNATYQFQNPTDERVTLQMGFPESRCVEDWSDCIGRGGEFRNMRTTVRGAQVRHRLGEVSVERSDDRARIGRVFLYNVRFAPNEQVEVTHTYSHDRNFSAMGEHLYYMTMTGRLWNGPIETAEFIVHVPYIPRTSVATYPGERRVVRQGGPPAGVEFRFRIEPFEPESDFELVLFGWEPEELTMGGVAGTQCPQVDEIAQAASGGALDEVSEHDALCGRAMAARWGGPVDASLEVALSVPQQLFEQYAVLIPAPHPDFDTSWMPERAQAYVAALASAPVARNRGADEAAEPAERRPNAGATKRLAPEDSPPNQRRVPSRGGCGCEASGRGGRGSGDTLPWLALLVLIAATRTTRKCRSR